MKVKINGQDIRVNSAVLFSHSEKIYEAEFEFDEAWNDYVKFAVFQLANQKAVAVQILNNKATLPKLRTSGDLRIGVYGTLGNKVMPTRWIEKVKVLQGTPIASEDWVDPDGEILPVYTVDDYGVIIFHRRRLER